MVFFWPLSLLVFSLKNDALTYSYPIRTLISDALNNGELPLWTPFINMGYPLHADMQSGAWNPVTWIFSFLTNYNLAAFHYELIFYITFAGIGFYYLCKELGCSKSIAFTIAIAYQFSGFITDSVQFFNCISGACYLPYVFLFFRRMIIRQRMKDAIPLAIFLFLLFTGGYPSLFIITCYSLLAYTLFIFFSAANKKLFLKRFLPPVSIACLFFLLLSLPAIISFFQHLPEIERGKSQTLLAVLENSMNPATTLSLLSPFSTTANDSWLSSSILMRSIYIGIVPLIFLVYSLFNKSLRKNKEIIFFFFCAIIMLGMAWGEYFFLRQLAYYTLPLMNTFRHPALFRLFTIFFFLLVAALSFNSWITSKEKNAVILKKIILSLMAIALTIGIVSMFFLKDVPSIGKLNGINLKTLLLQLNFQERYLIQFPFVFGILLLSYLAIVKKKSTRLICFIMIVDLFFATQLNMPVTVFGAKSFAAIEKSINRNPVKFPLPANQTIEENSFNSFDENIVTGSSIPFTKKIGRNDYYITPGNLSNQDEFYKSPIKDIIFKNPVLYFADTLIFPDNKELPYRAKVAFTDNRNIASAGKPGGSNSIQVKKFSANELQADVYNETGGLLVYLQNNYHGWQAFVDDKQTTLIRVNISFMAIQVPAGNHTIRFRYRPQLVVKAWYVSIFSFVLLIIIYWFLLSKKRSGKQQKGNI